MNKLKLQIAEKKAQKFSLFFLADRLSIWNKAKGMLAGKEKKILNEIKNSRAGW